MKLHGNDVMKLDLHDKNDLCDHCREQKAAAAADQAGKAVCTAL